MMCENCKNISNCKDKRDNPGFGGCTSGIPSNPIIKPCPFCGGNAILKEKYAIHCENSDCIVGSVAMIYRTKDLAIKAWNRRI